MALTKITGEGLGSLGTGNLTHGSDSGDTRFTLNSANQYTLVLKNAGNIAGQIGGSGSDVLRFSNAAGATIMEMNAGQITKPLQPAFLVTPNAPQNNIAVGSQVDIVFGNEVYDVGSNFASNAFTAPVTGKYQLNGRVRLGAVHQPSAYYTMRITTSNRVYEQIFDSNENSNGNLDYHPFEISVVADMDASDTAKIQIFQNSGTQETDIEAGSDNTQFSGFLAC